ncbi:MBL fold metallo-hydrolase [Protaetiibacter mangrovi]|uniref:MBL fold metallo-hydrolase n=1 Tax=Protaetiibacter mangrovi TaxID=2970926 RepID=A0ABT1ZCR7_9MICO|nr:MBL fold metallo-hydrolase [Protaetiibacter mangrovi]MCS0498513.1 MBL fold metallo-hydrolase [Protaetiibacter mangrovi]TPX02851.1 MBL fold metallo-hydrolase [Schumannella luteola]
MNRRITVTPIRVAELLGVDDGMPVYVHLIEHPDARVLVDTGLTRLHPALADLDPRILPRDPRMTERIDLVVNTHLHADHCGGNHLFDGVPIHVQRRELDDARTRSEYTIPEWVDPPGAPVRYVPVDGERELLPGVRLLPAPGHTAGSQIVVIENGAHPELIVGDTAVWSGELDEPTTEGQRLVRSLDPARVWMSHAHEAWRPSAPRD